MICTPMPTPGLTFLILLAPVTHQFQYVLELFVEHLSLPSHTLVTEARPTFEIELDVLIYLWCKIAVDNFYPVCQLLFYTINQNIKLNLRYVFNHCTHITFEYCPRPPCPCPPRPRPPRPRIPMCLLSVGRMLYGQTR